MNKDVLIIIVNIVYILKEIVNDPSSNALYISGEIVRISKDGIKSMCVVPRPDDKASAFCIFEYVYFARPDSIFEGKLCLYFTTVKLLHNGHPFCRGLVTVVDKCLLGKGCGKMSTMCVERWRSQSRSLDLLDQQKSVLTCNIGHIIYCHVYQLDRQEVLFHN